MSIIFSESEIVGAAVVWSANIEQAQRPAAFTAKAEGGAEVLVGVLLPDTPGTDLASGGCWPRSRTERPLPASRTAERTGGGIRMGASATGGAEIEVVFGSQAVDPSRSPDGAGIEHGTDRLSQSPIPRDS